jgi:hypothetical protein
MTIPTNIININKKYFEKFNNNEYFVLLRACESPCGLRRISDCFKCKPKDSGNWYGFFIKK